MSGTQTTILFPVRKKNNFYGKKEVKEDFTNATVRNTSSKYVPTVKKIVTLTSSESESDSDIENTTEKCKVTRDRRTENAGNTPRRRKCDKPNGKCVRKYIILFYLKALVKNCFKDYFICHSFFWDDNCYLSLLYT